MTAGTSANPQTTSSRAAATRPGIWVVLVMSHETDNVEATTRRILACMPACRILIVDVARADAGGLVVDTLATADTRVEVLHLPEERDLARLRLAGFAAVLARGADIVVQVDADGAYDPAALWQLILPIAAGGGDLAIGSRHVAGAAIIDWGWEHRLGARLASFYARTIVGVPVHDLTGGYRAWRSSTLRAVKAEPIGTGGWVFQVEMASRALEGGARVTEVPITFRGRPVRGPNARPRMVRDAGLLTVRLGLQRLTRRRATETPVT